MRQEGITHIPPIRRCVPLNKAVPASQHSRGWERAPSCSGNAADHFPFPLPAPA